MPSDLFAFAGDAWLCILIFKIIWVAPTLGPALMGLCCLQKKIYQYSENNASHSLFLKQTCHKSIYDTGSIDSDVWRIILWCVSSADLYFHSVHFESIFQLWVPVSHSWMWIFPGCWPCTLRQGLSLHSHSSVPQCRADSWQCSCHGQCSERLCSASPSQHREIQQSPYCGIPWFLQTMSCVWGWSRHSCALTGDVGPQLFPKGCTHLLLGSQPLHVPWGLSICPDPPTDDGHSGWLLQLPKNVKQPLISAGWTHCWLQIWWQRGEEIIIFFL